MIRRPPRSTRTYTLCPYTTRCRSKADRAAGLRWVRSPTALDSRPHAFRLDFDAPEDIERAEILISGKDHMRGVWINGEHKNPDALPLGLGWDTMLPFWGTLLPLDRKSTRLNSSH